jgi:hypothetical protein
MRLTLGWPIWQEGLESFSKKGRRGNRRIFRQNFGQLFSGWVWNTVVLQSTKPGKIRQIILVG